MAKHFNPGQLIIYATALLTIFSVVFAGIFSRLDTLVLGLGIVLVTYSLEQPISVSLLLASLAIFLSSYLPFGNTSSYLIQGFSEGFQGPDPDDDDEDDIKGFRDMRKGEGFQGSDSDSDDDDDDDIKVVNGFRDMSKGEGFQGSDSDSDDDDDDDIKVVNGFRDMNTGEGFQGSDSDSEDEEGGEEEEGEGFASADFTSKDTMEGFASEEKKPKKKSRPPPDHGSRAEMFELGKKYKMPKETDDPEYHLDAGTTFLNAYKSLNPDQISAMTKDTQDLINTQKQLMTTLNTLKPLITDGKQMMDTFQNYFGAATGGGGGGGGGLGDLAKMAEKFAPQ